MTCDQARAAFSDLYDNVLSGAPLVTLTHHLHGCQTCRTEWAVFQRAMQAVTDLGSAEPSLGFAARIRQRVEEPTRWQRLVDALFRPLRVKIPIHAVALLLVGLGGVLMYQRSPELRREAEFAATPPPPATRQAPAETPAPPAPPPAEKAAKGKEEMKAEADAFRGQRAEPKARPPESVHTAPQARLDAEKGRVPSPLRDEAKGLGKITTPSGPPKVAEPPQELRAKRPESGGAARRLEPSAPRPTESPAPVPERQPSALPSQSADELYSAAGRDLSRRDYDQAVSGFRTFITEHPRDARIPDARLRLADAYVAQQRYADAIREYETLVRESPGSPLIPAALYRLGQARLALGDQAGCRVLRDLADRYPAAPEAALAREGLTTRCP